jgi:hypothetical protein
LAVRKEDLVIGGITEQFLRVLKEALSKLRLD